MKRVILMSSIVVLLAGCNGALPAAVTRLTTPGSTNSQDGRSVKVVVNAPNTLASNGKLVSGDVSNVIAAGGGNVIAAGGGNVIAAGGGNVIAAGAGNFTVADAWALNTPSEAAPGIGFHVLDSISAFTAVQNAAVQIQKLDGTPVGKNAFLTDANGAVDLSGIPDGDPLQAITYFKVGDQLYREAVPLGTGSTDAPVYADPINTMVAAAVSKWIGGNTLAGKLVNFDTLKNVWSICNKAGITLKPADLNFTQGEEASQLVTTLAGKWTDAINAQDANHNYVLSATDRAALAAFKTLLTGGKSS
ncbi:MAG TPA: hypothetical protein V6D47_15865 [Oscillatoriaceae cyanobacterium]